jgi:hypothetical protein
VNYDSTGPLAPKVLVIRGVDDEAALALAFGAIATTLNRFLLRATWQWMYKLIVFSVFLMAGLTAVGWVRFDSSLIMRIAVVGWCVVMFGTGIFLILPGLFNARFGIEFLFGAMRCEIATDSTPHSTRVQIVTLKPMYREMLPQGQKK